MALCNRANGLFEETYLLCLEERSGRLGEGHEIRKHHLRGSVSSKGRANDAGFLAPSTGIRVEHVFIIVLCEVVANHCKDTKVQDGLILYLTYSTMKIEGQKETH